MERVEFKTGDTVRVNAAGTGRHGDVWYVHDCAPDGVAFNGTSVLTGGRSSFGGSVVVEVVPEGTLPAEVYYQGVRVEVADLNGGAPPFDMLGWSMYSSTVAMSGYADAVRPSFVERYNVKTVATVVVMLAIAVLAAYMDYR